LPTGRPHAHTLGTPSPWRLPGPWRRPCWLGPATRVPRCHVRRAFTRIRASACDSLGELSCVSASIARDRPGLSEAIGGGGHCGRTARHRPDLTFPPIAHANLFAWHVRQARSGASHEVCSPSAHAGGGASKPGRMPAIPGRSRFGVFAAGPRACFAVPIGGVRPCGFALEAGAGRCRRCGGLFGVPCAVAILRNATHGAAHRR